MGPFVSLEAVRHQLPKLNVVGSIPIARSNFHLGISEICKDQVAWVLPCRDRVIRLVDWDLHFLDATIVRAHQHAAGARRTDAIALEGEALGRSQVDCSTKLHLRAQGSGARLTAMLMGGERHEQTARRALRARRITPVIPTRKDLRHQPTFNR